MAGLLTTTGICTADPIVTASGDALVEVQIDWSIQTIRPPTRATYVLDADAAKTVDLGEFDAGVHVLHVDTDQPVTLTITTSVATAQAIPVEQGIHLQFPTATPLTALTLTRPAGVETILKLLLAEEPA